MELLSIIIIIVVVFAVPMVCDFFRNRRKSKTD